MACAASGWRRCARGKTNSLWSRWARCSACRLLITHAVTVWPLAPTRRNRGSRSSSPTPSAGSIATAACGDWTRATGWAASAPRQGRSTTARGPFACRGTIRWAGLDKILPPSTLLRELAGRIDATGSELDSLEEAIEVERERLRVLALDVEALRAAEHFSGVYETRMKELQAGQADFQTLVRRQMELSETRTALLDYRRRVERGDLGSPTTHIRSAHHPTPVVVQHRALELWAAISGALALLAFGYLTIYRPDNWILLVIIVGVIFGLVDAIARGKVDRYLTGLTVALALITALILFVEFWQIALILPLVLLVIFMLRDNLRELI